jgi:hypothetical protein
VAKLNVNAKITAPETINIPLVRADVLHVSTTFRVCFEVFLSLTSVLLGYVLSIQDVLFFHWVSLVVCAGATVAFLILSLRKQSEATIQS